MAVVFHHIPPSDLLSRRTAFSYSIIVSILISLNGAIPTSEPENSSPEAEGEDGNLTRFHGEAALSSVENAAVNYQSPFLIATGASAQIVSVITAMSSFLLALTCVKAPEFIRRIGPGRKGTVIVALLNAFVWVPLIVSILFFRSNIPTSVYALLWLVNLVPATVLAIQTDNWLARIIPKSILGRYLGRRQAIRSMSYFTSVSLLGLFLDRFTGGDESAFAFVFGVAFIAALGNVLIFRFMKNPQKTGVETAFPMSPGSFLAEVRRAKLSRYFLFVSLFHFTVNLCGPLYAIYMLRDLHFTYLGFTLVISLEFLARVVSAPAWGRYADRAGNIRVISIVSRIIPLLPVMWLFYHNIAYLAVVQIISGVCWGAFDLCTQSYVYRTAPASMRLRYVIYSRSLLLLCTAAGGITGALVYEGGFPVFGSSILGIFLISGIFRLLVVIAMVPKLVDMALDPVRPVNRTEFDEDKVKDLLAAGKGLYHRHQYSEGPRADAITDNDAGAFPGPGRRLGALSMLADSRNKAALTPHALRLEQERLPSINWGSGYTFSNRKDFSAAEKRTDYRKALYHDAAAQQKYLDKFSTRETAKPGLAAMRDYLAGHLPRKISWLPSLDLEPRI